MTDTAAEILLLGTFHMANPGRDMANVSVDDVLAPHRQAEIAAVVAGLARFAPTKVAVERDTDGRTHVDPRSEVEQLGTRLVDTVGLDAVHPIDVMDRFYIDAIEDLVQRDADHAARWARLLAAGAADTAETEGVLASGTVGEVLRTLNTAEARARALRPYLELVLPIAGDGNWSGPDMVANWYRRNFRIAANLLAITEPGDRIVVIYGAGHIPVLEHVLTFHPGLTLVDPLPYLCP